MVDPMSKLLESILKLNLEKSPKRIPRPFEVGSKRAAESPWNANIRSSTALLRPMLCAGAPPHLIT